MKGVKLELNQNRIVLPSRNIAGAMQESRFVSDGFAISFPYGGRRMQECEKDINHMDRVVRKKRLDKDRGL